MIGVRLGLALCALVYYSESALAAEPARGEAVTAPAKPALRGVQVGARGGIMFPGGEASKGVLLDDVVGRGFPAQLNLGYRFNERFAAGGYAQYAFTTGGGPACGGTTAADCGGTVIRYGVDAELHVTPARKFDLWVGFGIGAERASWDIESGGGFIGNDASGSLSGLEFLHTTLGVDFPRKGGRQAIGVFITGTNAQYLSYESTTKVSGSPVTASGSIPGSSKALHHWIMLGIRGVFVL